MKSKIIIALSLVLISGGIALQVTAQPECSLATKNCSTVTCYKNQAGTWDSCEEWHSDLQPNGPGIDVVKVGGNENCGRRKSGVDSCSDWGAGCGGFSVTNHCDNNNGGGE